MTATLPAPTTAAPTTPPTFEELHARLTAELTVLEAVDRPRVLAAIGEITGGDSADVAERTARELDLAQLDARIGRLKDRLVALARPAGAGLGSAVVLDFGDGPETYTLGEYAPGAESVITPGSPLGRALAGARAGQRVGYATPRGTATVTVVSVGAGRRPPDRAVTRRAAGVLAERPVGTVLGRGWRHSMHTW